MIEINLLPEELKKLRKFYFIEPKMLVFYSIILVFGILVFLHIFLTMLSVARSRQYRVLTDKWEQLLPQRQEVEKLRQEYNILLADAQIIQQLTNQRINWAEKINKLSLYLPGGVWFEALSVSNKQFELKGIAISLQKGELDLINKFLSSLKNDARFFKDFNNLELSSVERKEIVGYDVVTFVLSGKLK